MSCSGEHQTLSRRAFLARSVVVAGGAAAIPLMSQQQAKCATRAASGPTIDSDATTTTPNVDRDDLEEVTDNILCEGGCGKTVYLGELTDACPIATRMKQEAAGYLAQGMTPPQVLDRFVADFGEGVLAAPSRSGFNLIAWLLPLAGLALGGVSIAGALSKWRGAQPLSTPTTTETDPALLSRVDEEVNEGL